MIIKYDTTMMDATAAAMQQHIIDLQGQVLSVWSDLITQAGDLPTYANADEPQRVLSDTIDTLTRLLALRKFVADKLAQDAKTVAATDHTLAIVFDPTQGTH